MMIRSFAIAGSAGLAALAFASSASAQGYYDTRPGYESCENVRNGRTAGGAVVGALVGGLFGNQVAARGARDEGTAVGAVVGALAGGAVARQSVDCAAHGQYGNEAYGYGQPSGPHHADYGYGGGFEAPTRHPNFHAHDNLVGDNYSSASYQTEYPSNAYSSGYGTGGGGAGYGSSTDYGSGSYASGSDGLYGGQEECRTVQSVVRLPDGRETLQDQLACYDPYSGQWRVQ